MKLYNKLVRDRIPQIIEDSGRTPETKSLNKEETIAFLIQKFDEEVEEFKEDHSMEELADILEIVHGLAYHLNYDFQALEKVRKQKFEERGGFEEGIKLIGV